MSANNCEGKGANYRVVYKSNVRIILDLIYKDVSLNACYSV